MAESAISPPGLTAPPDLAPAPASGASAAPGTPPDPLAPRGIPLTGLRRRLARTAVVLVALLAAVHSAMLLMYVASDFPLSKTYTKQTDWWMRPMFPQDWSIFAPDPSRYNLHLEVRTRVDGKLGPWLDLTAYDNSRYRGDLLPSIEDQLVLRRAVSQYQTSARNRSRSEEADSARSRNARYLLNVVRVRLADMGRPTGDAVELRTRATRIPPPGGGATSEPARYRTLGFWKVTR
ncbi:DUF5819 family protein [Streptomyces sp. NPDC051561]|uniref:DUF5819 family protein n=1 Tax=Streptomyces sp. NPDC051561 TaxID=3365658 RepID=UPI0037B83871